MTLAAHVDFEELRLTRAFDVIGFCEQIKRCYLEVVQFSFGGHPYIATFLPEQGILASSVATDGFSA